MPFLYMTKFIRVLYKDSERVMSHDLFKVYRG